jgi:hypothetical protein
VKHANHAADQWFSALKGLAMASPGVASATDHRFSVLKGQAMALVARATDHRFSALKGQEYHSPGLAAERPTLGVLDPKPRPP